MVLPTILIVLTVVICLAGLLVQAFLSVPPIIEVSVSGLNKARYVLDFISILKACGSIRLTL